MWKRKVAAAVACFCWISVALTAQDGEVYERLKSYLESVPAIDTHDHLPPFSRLPGYRETQQGRGMNLAGLWHNSYFKWVHSLTPWTERGSFQDWWSRAKGDFRNARATSVYRYMLPAFRDLYGVDFESMTPEQADELNRRIFANYRDEKWLLGYPFNRTHPGRQFSRGGSLEGAPGSAGARASGAAWATPPGAAWWR